MSPQASTSCLLTESFLFEYKKDSIVNEEDGSLTVVGIIQRADAENQNGRVYPYEILKLRVDEYNQLIRESRAFGELDHAESPIVNMQNVSHMITEIWWKEKTVWGKVKIMPTTTGQNLITIIKCGGVPGISSRSTGSVRNVNGVDVVNNDLQIICWDFVSEPSTHQAFMRLSEAMEYDPKKRRTTNKNVALQATLDEILGLTTGN